MLAYLHAIHWRAGEWTVPLGDPSTTARNVDFKAVAGFLGRRAEGEEDED